MDDRVARLLTAATMADTEQEAFDLAIQAAELVRGYPLSEDERRYHRAAFRARVSTLARVAQSRN